MGTTDLNALFRTRISRRSFTAGTAITAGLALASIRRPALAAAAQFSAGDIAYATDDLNFRDAPSLSGKVLHTWPAGKMFHIYDGPFPADGYTWYKAAPEAVDPPFVGYLAGEYLTSDDSGGDGPKFAPGASVYVNSGPLNLRSAPSLSASIIAGLPESTLGTILDGPVAADGWVWYKLQTAGGTTGWSVEDYLSVSKGPVEGDIGPGATIKVVDGPLNIRSAPGTANPVIDRAATGAVATVIDGPVAANGYTWIRIDGNLLEIGWVAYEFCQAI